MIAPLLKNGFEIHATSRAWITSTGVHCHGVDLLDEAAVSALVELVRPSHLIHLAWITESPAYWHSSLNVIWESRSMHLFEAFARAGGSRLVSAGSCAEYEWGSDVLDEQATPEVPATPYGQAKLSLLRRAQALATKNRITFSWARFFFLFGPHERDGRFVPSIIDPLLRKNDAYCHHGKLNRDFLYVEDAGDAVVAIAMSGVNGVVNVGSGLASQLGAMAQEIGREMKLPNLVHIADDHTGREQPQSLVANTSRLNRDVGWTPRFDRQSALQRTIAWRASREGTRGA